MLVVGALERAGGGDRSGSCRGSSSGGSSCTASSGA